MSHTNNNIIVVAHCSLPDRAGSLLNRGSSLNRPPPHLRVARAPPGRTRPPPAASTAPRASFSSSLATGSPKFWRSIHLPPFRPLCRLQDDAVAFPSLPPEQPARSLGILPLVPTRLAGRASRAKRLVSRSPESCVSRCYRSSTSSRVAQQEKRRRRPDGRGS